MKRAIICAVATIAVAIPAMAEGDIEYGQYLSSECVTCHQPGKADAEIPTIDGMDPQALGDIMKLYRSKELENPAMQTVAGRLTDEDISALAAYFASLPEPE